MIARIIVGSGNNRHVFETSRDRVTRDKQAEDIKNFLFRPALLNKAK